MTGASLGWPPPCSEWARSQELSPIGSAGHYAGYVLVELPLPWPPDISALAELADVVDLVNGAGLRLQAIAPPGGAVQRRRVIYYGTARPGWAGPLRRREGDAGAGPGALAEAVADLLAGGAGSSARAGPGPEVPGPQVVDVLVCTHGRRDACCGGRGTELVRALAAPGPAGPVWGSAPSGGSGAVPEVRLWRTSHTGGHRFAPTALVLPSATLWAWADVDLLERVVRSEGPLADVVSRYRGCATLGAPPQQAVDKSVLAEVGWPLLSSWRRAWSAGDGLVQLETESSGTWEARVAEGRHVPQPECRTPPELATKQSVEWVVGPLRHVAPV
jgi:hypothetical protein